MEIHARALDLALERAFTISRGSRDLARNILVEIHHEGVVGRGEGAPNSRYGQDQESSLQALSEFELPTEILPFHLAEIVGRFTAHHPTQRAARCALEMALWDWIGQAQDEPLHGLLSIAPVDPPLSSYTISIDDLEGIAKRVDDAGNWPILKLKLGGGDADRRSVEALRALTDKPFRVDANEAWSAAEAREKIPWLAEMGCDLVEQPLPAGRLEEVAALREESPLPLVADEDATDLRALGTLAGVYDGINVKLMKAGGLGEAVAMIHAARGLGLEIMLGCFVESSLGISAAAHLSPLAQWADLDGAALLRDDPFAPAVVEEGRIRIPRRAGLGVAPRNP